MKNKTISVLAAAAISIGLGLAATSSATAAPAIGQMQTSAYAGNDLLTNHDAVRRHRWKHIIRWSEKRPKIQLNPKVCYERKRVGPKQYVLVRRAC